MKRYELVKSSREINFRERKKIEVGVTLEPGTEQEILETFKTKKEALERLNNFYNETEITKASGTLGTFYEISEYSVNEIEYTKEDDEEDEYIDYVEEIAISPMKINVIEEPSFKIIATFDNLMDAEYKLDELEESYHDELCNGEKEYYISF